MVPYILRRGSNVSLVLDVSSLSLGAVEPLCSISTPKETLLHLLRTLTRPLTPSQLQEASEETSRLNSEYQVGIYCNCYYVQTFDCMQDQVESGP